MKILLIRLSSLGDVLLTTPAVRCLKRQLPQAELHFLTKKANASLLEANPYIDRLHLLSDPMDETLAQLKEEHYDWVVDLHNNHRSTYLRRALGCRTSVYNKENFHKFVYILTKRNVMSGRHVVDRYLDALQPLGIRPDDEGLDLFLPERLQGDSYRALSVGDTTVGALTEHPYVAIACGAQHATKRIPNDKLEELCTLLRHPVLLLGDKSDRQRLSGCTFPAGTRNLCGLTDMALSAALVRDAAAVIAPDTGLMHVAAAFHRPVVALWAATAPPLGFTPYRCDHYDARVDGLRCQPCSRQGGERCPRGHYHCMNRQDWSAIARIADAMADNTYNPGYYEP